MCDDRLTTAIDTLENQLKRLNSATNINLEDIIQMSLSDLENLKNNLISQVQSYFSNIKDEYVSKIRNSEARFHDYSGLKDELQNVIEELHTIKYNLNTPSTFEAIRNTVKLNSDALLGAFDKQVEEALNKSVSLPIKFVFSESDLHSFSNVLKKIVSVFSKDVKVVTNEKYLNEIKHQKKVTEVETQNKSYFNHKFQK